MRPLLYRTCTAPSAGRLVEELFTQLRGRLPHAGVREYSLPREHARVYPPGHSRRTVRPDLLRSMRPQILELGLASEAELDDMDAAVRAHFDDPRTVVLPHLFFLTSGRKPRMG